MKEGMTLLLGNIATVMLAGLAAYLIHDGQSAWVWAWFLALAYLTAVSPSKRP